MRRRMSMEERLRRNSDDAANGCRLWVGGFRNRGGYGVFVFDGKIKLAHRASYELAKGEIPSGLCVLHSCDTPGCINPDHLRLGTPADNAADRNAKGRTARGPALAEAQRLGRAAKRNQGAAA